MTSEEIQTLMMSATASEAQATKEEIAGLLAGRIATLFGKLSKEELYGLIAIGALLYQQPEPEPEDPPGITEDLLIKTLKIGGNA